MPIEQVAPPTREQVAAEIQAFESKYGITSVYFVLNNDQLPEVNEDDAVEWLYLIEQFRTLTQMSGRCESRTEHATSVSDGANAYDVMVALAA